ncbi:MAG TPA: class I SAM-dependent methyltransferase [Verrucomicrobiae bacterium]
MALETPPNLYSPDFIKHLFDEMAHTYGTVNLISSLGFTCTWRRACINQIPGSGTRVLDLMTGGGECLGDIKRKYGSDTQVELVDWSEVMCARARKLIAQKKFSNCRVICGNALALPTADATYDAVYSTFGLKTLTMEEVGLLAREIKRVLKPGGYFCLMEISVPQPWWLRPGFKIYVKYVVPFLGRLFLGNPDNYRLLWEYTKAFGNCDQAARIFRENGLHTRQSDLFFTSATQIYGQK